MLQPQTWCHPIVMHHQDAPETHLAVPVISILLYDHFVFSSDISAFIYLEPHKQNLIQMKKVTILFMLSAFRYPCPLLFSQPLLNLSSSPYALLKTTFLI